MSVFFEFVFSVKDKKNWQALSSKVSPEVIFNALFFFSGNEAKFHRGE